MPLPEIPSFSTEMSLPHALTALIKFKRAYEYLLSGRMGAVNIDIAAQTASMSGTANANGYLMFDTASLTPGGYASLGIMGATITTPNPTTSGTKPSLGWDTRYVYAWNGTGGGTIALNVTCLYIASDA
jgi:hypothetical protein